MKKSLRMRLLMRFLRHYEKPRLARLEDPKKERRRFDGAARFFRKPRKMLHLRRHVNGVPCDWVSCQPKRRQVILYLHGGAHVVGSTRTHRAMVARLCRMTGLQALVPDVRLAPEHPLPAAVEDAQHAWEGLRALGYSPDQIIIGGDSSGGGLAFALLAGLLARGERPLAAFGFAPLVDMSFSGASFTENADRDALLPSSQAGRVCQFYLNGADARDPRASPLFADFPKPPPVFLQAAETEILRDDTKRLADLLQRSGGLVELDMWPDAPHVWVLFQGWVPESDAALRRAARFIAAACSEPR